MLYLADFRETKKEINALLEKIAPTNEAIENENPIESDLDILFSSPQAKRTKNSKFHRELDMFASSNSKLTGQKFWDANQQDMPNLYRIQKQTGAMQLTSASIERLFSQAKLVYNDLAAQMDPETLFFNLLNSKNFE